MEENKPVPTQDNTNKKEEDKEQENIDNIIPEEVLEAIPVEERGKIISIIKQSMFHGVMGRGNPISEKITTEHITKLIDKSDSHDIRDREERKSARNYNLIIMIIALAFLGFLVVFLVDKEDILYKILIAIIAFVGGFGAGKTAKKSE